MKLTYFCENCNEQSEKIDISRLTDLDDLPLTVSQKDDIISQEDRNQQFYISYICSDCREEIDYENRFDGSRGISYLN